MSGAVASSSNDQILFPGAIIEIPAYNIPGFVQDKMVGECVFKKSLIGQDRSLDKAGIFEAG